MSNEIVGLPSVEDARRLIDAAYIAEHADTAERVTAQPHDGVSAPPVLIVKITDLDSRPEYEEGHDGDSAYITGYKNRYLVKPLTAGYEFALGGYFREQDAEADVADVRVPAFPLNPELDADTEDDDGNPVSNPLPVGDLPWPAILVTSDEYDRPVFALIGSIPSEEPPEKPQIGNTDVELHGAAVGLEDLTDVQALKPYLEYVKAAEDDPDPEQVPQIAFQGVAVEEGDALTGAVPDPNLVRKFIIGEGLTLNGPSSDELAAIPEGDEKRIASIKADPADMPKYPITYLDCASLNNAKYHLSAALDEIVAGGVRLTVYPTDPDVGVPDGSVPFPTAMINHAKTINVVSDAPAEDLPCILQTDPCCDAPACECSCPEDSGFDGDVLIVGTNNVSMDITTAGPNVDYQDYEAHNGFWMFCLPDPAKCYSVFFDNFSTDLVVTTEAHGAGEIHFSADLSDAANTATCNSLANLISGDLMNGGHDDAAATDNIVDLNDPVNDPNGFIIPVTGVACQKKFLTASFDFLFAAMAQSGKTVTFDIVIEEVACGFEPTDLPEHLTTMDFAELKGAGKLWKDAGKTTPADFGDVVRAIETNVGDWTAASDGAAAILTDEGGGKVSLTANGTSTVYLGPTGLYAGTETELYYITRMVQDGYAGPGNVFQWNQFVSDSSTTYFAYSGNGNVYDNFGTNTRNSFTPTMSLSSYRTYEVAVDGSTWHAWLDGVSQLWVGNVLPSPSATLPLLFCASWQGRLAGFTLTKAIPTGADLTNIRAFYDALA